LYSFQERKTRGWDKSPSLLIIFGLSSKTQWLSGLYYADFISFYSPTQLCGGGTTKSNSNELTISVPLSFFHFICYARCILLELRQDEGGSILSTWGVSESCWQGTIVLSITRIEHAL